MVHQIQTFQGRQQAPLLPQPSGPFDVAICSMKNVARERVTNMQTLPHQQLMALVWGKDKNVDYKVCP